MAYVRKTKDVYVLQGNYGYGWEDILTEHSRKDVMEQYKCYRKNEVGASHRIITRRERVGE